MQWNTDTMGTYPQDGLETRQWWSGQDENDDTDKDRQNNMKQNKERTEGENINRKSTLE